MDLHSNYIMSELYTNEWQFKWEMWCGVDPLVFTKRCVQYCTYILVDDNQGQNRTFLSMYTGSLNGLINITIIISYHMLHLHQNSIQLQTYGRYWNTSQHHCQNTTWKDAFWKNGINFARTGSKACWIYIKIHYALLRHVLFFSFNLSLICTPFITVPNCKDSSMSFNSLTQFFLFKFGHWPSLLHVHLGDL